MSQPPAPTAESLQAAIAALEAQRVALGDAVVDIAVAGLRAQLEALQVAPSADAQALRLVSILFLDVVGSTSLGQRLDPEEVHAVMDGAMARFTGVVQAHGGRVLQYAGDSLLAGFGAAEVHEDDAERAVRCGLALLADAREVGDAVRAAHAHEGFGVRVGIHSGRVLLGGGVDAEGSIRGSAVNIAARMEQSAAPGSLLISVDTYRLVPGRFEVQQGQLLQVKGIDAPVLSFVVERELPRGARQVRHGLDAVATPLVGREANLAQLQAALRDAQRAPQQLTLIGDAGLGKSRLLAEFVAALPASAATLEASAHPQGQHRTYGVIRDLLFRSCDVQDGDALAQAQAKLAAGLAPLFGARAEEQTALLGQLVGLDYRASPFIAGIQQDGQQLRARALHAWVEYLRLRCEQLAPGGVLVLVLDDLHWADDSSLDAIAHVARTVRELPLLLLCAARPELLERRPQWAADWPAHRALVLAPLADAECHALARALLQPLGNHPEAPQLQRLLIERTDGNPFHMEALLQMLADHGVLDTHTTPWQLAAADGLPDLQVPATLVGVLQARLDALQPAQRRALQQASVVGAVFWDETLAALDARAPAALDGLSQRGLVLPQAQSAFGDALEFAFRHHVLHDVTYGTVLKRERLEQHRRVALWLEARSAGRGGEFACLIAGHFERAGIADRAAAHWACAAQEAAARHADGAALAHAERALALDPGDDAQRRFALLRVRATVWSRRGDVAEHRKAIDALEALADAQGDAVMRLIAAQARMHRLCWDGEHEQALALGRERLAAAEALAPLEAARARNLMLIALARQSRHAEAREQAHAALALARAAGDAYTEASLLNNLSVGYTTEYQLREATLHGEQALALYRRIGSRYGEAIALLNLAYAAQMRGQLVQARDQLVDLMAMSDAIDHQQIRGQSRCNLASVLAEQGEAEDALAYALEGIRIGRQNGDRYTQASGHAAAFDSCYRLGRWQQAVEHGRLAQAGYAANGEPGDALANEAGWACALQQAGDAAGAAAAAEALLAAAAGRGGWQADEADAALWCARLLRLLEDPRAADAAADARRVLAARAAAFEDPAEGEQFMRATALRREILGA